MVRKKGAFGTKYRFHCCGDNPNFLAQDKKYSSWLIQAYWSLRFQFKQCTEESSPETKLERAMQQHMSFK